MKTIIFVTFVVLLVVACIGTNQSLSDLLISKNENPSSVFAIYTEVVYQSNLNNNYAPGKIISLSLVPNHKAEMRTNSLSDDQIVIDKGTWNTLENGKLLLKLHHQGKKESFLIEFKVAGENLICTGNKLDIDGLVLWEKPLP